MDDISVGQIWIPAPDKMVAMREVVGLKLDLDGHPAVVYLAILPDRKERAIMRLKGFRDWIRKTQATYGDRYD